MRCGMEIEWDHFKIYIILSQTTFNEIWKYIILAQKQNVFIFHLSLVANNTIEAVLEPFNGFFLLDFFY